MSTLRLGRKFVGLAGICIFAFIYLPILVVVVFSFNPGTLGVVDFSHFTMNWYAKLIQDGDILQALQNSLLVSIPAVIISVTMGAYAAIVFHRYKFRTAKLMMALLLMPYIMPGIVTGVSLALLFKYLNIPGSLLTVIIGHVTIITPFAMFLVLNRLRQLDPNLENAALDLGATPARAVKDIILPNISTAVIGAALLSFTISFDEIAVTFFLVGPQQTLPVKIWGMLRFGYTPEINALYTIVFVVSIILITLTSKTLHSK